MSFIALLDANVLWPAALRCVLVRAAIAGLYRPAWTPQILAEMADSLVREGRASRERMNRTVQINGMSHLTPKFASTVLSSGMLDDEDAFRASPIRERRENYRCPTLPN